MNHLDQMLAGARERLEGLPPLDPATPASGRGLALTLAGREQPAIICAFMRRDPARGGPQEERVLLPTVRSFARAGAHAVAILTEPSLFGGRLLDLELAVEALDVPVLMSDLVLAPAQVHAASALGAWGVELVARALDDETLDALMLACKQTQILPLVQCFDGNDLERALARPGAAVRITDMDLTTFAHDRSRVLELSSRVPTGRLCVAPWDLDDPASNADLRGKVDAFWLGSAFASCPNPADIVQEIMS